MQKKSRSHRIRPAALNSDIPARAIGWSVHSVRNVRNVRTARCRHAGRQAAERYDPLEVLGPDLVLSVLSFLKPKDLARCTALSHRWCQLASDDRLWTPLCETLWDKKESIAPAALVESVRKIDAYRISFYDGLRNVVTEDDLCDNNWTCRFRENPFWAGVPPMKRFFSRDGTISAGDNSLMYGSRSFPWRIRMEMKGKKQRAVVEVGTFPELYPKRRPDWGWTIQNELITYSSIGRKT